MNKLFLRPGPLIGIGAGALAGGAAYAATRVFLASMPPVGAILVGLLAGIGARLGHAVSVRTHMQALVYGSLVMTFAGEFAAFAFVNPRETWNDFPSHLIAHPVTMLLMLVFLVTGLFLGVKLLVGDAEGVFDDG